MNGSDEFQPRGPVTIDWLRHYDIGPSDEHLHAVGQFMANYSMVEWEISGLFAYFIGLPVPDAQRLAVDSNLSMAGKLRYVQGQLEDRDGVNQESAKDLLASLKEFENVSKLRHKIVHWQWGLNEGHDATLTDLIKPRNPERATVTLPLNELRDECFRLAKIYRAMTMNFLVISGQFSREMLLAARSGTSAEKLFRP
ncbi:hypothetical protein [Pseudomonas mosselii]|uniref:hypothetical protein n=1 Tax=Pseudomonas mosselii TaxID=78327 RepID=UPI001112EC16|nr:hypothetical protein [Pseudomonas mosselii]